LFPSRFAWGLLACTPLLYASALFHAPIACAATSDRPLSLPEALARTRAANPSLVASRRDVTAARSLEREARRRPAPSFLAEYENFGADLGGGFSEATLTAQQTFELGGDRAARQGLSASHTAIAQADHEQLRHEVEATTVEAFSEAWTAQERAACWREAVRDAATAETAAAARLRAGAAPAHEVARARANHALHRIELEREERLLVAARDRLAAQWRGNADSIGALVLGDPLAIAAADRPLLESAAALQPSMRRALAERERSEVQSKWLRAQRVPDVTVGAGARHLAEFSSTGFVMSVSIALPGPGTGPDAVASADTTRAAGAARLEAERLRQLTRIRGVHDRLTSALASIRELREQVLPASEDAVRGLASAFRAGGLTVLEMLEGQRALLEARMLDIELTREAWVSQMELERWTSETAGGEAR
jgi:cobalt-zinc-cadmium efflux system outer membrane protein